MSARSLISRYKRAVENLPESRHAFEQLDQAAPPGDRDIWLAEIQSAESKRSVDHTAMDVMQSRIKGGATLKAVTADIRNRDSVSKSPIADDGTNTDWLLEGLQIEDEQ